MNILIINCSPVRNGATAEIVNLVKEHVEEGNVVKSVCIDDYDIKLCKGCRKCHETAKKEYKCEYVILMKKILS